MKLNILWLQVEVQHILNCDKLNGYVLLLHRNTSNFILSYSLDNLPGDLSAALAAATADLLFLLPPKLARRNISESGFLAQLLTPRDMSTLA